jgi:pectate lyase
MLHVLLEITVRRSLRWLPGVFLGFASTVALGGGANPAPDFTEWTSGSGVWTNASQWSDGLPNPYQRTEVHGMSTVIIPPGDYIAGDLEVGLKQGDHAHVELDGGRLLLLQDSLRIGELSGGEGEFILRSGALHCPVDVYSGAANSVPGRATKAALRIQGGEFLARTLNVGSGWGADSLLAIEGSRASAIHVLDYCYIQAYADTAGNPGMATLSFTLDEHGVTPITVQSRRDGLRILKDAKSRCRLQILLGAVPPREDVPLVMTHRPTRGTFDDLPEGSMIMAQFQGHTYRWQLTYSGGASGTDLILENRSDYPADAPVTHTRPLPEVPKPLWTLFKLYPLSADLPGVPAFPGAEGFGAFTPGGRGGKMIYVDNLNDSGPGSLRAAIQTIGPRILVFRVGGVIPLKSTLRIEEPYLTMDGQNAPGPGILLRNHGIEVTTHDVILRYFRVRVGDDDVHLENPKARESYFGGSGEHALYFIEGSKNCIADHLSLSWSTTKILSVTKLSDLITVQWCILSEALNFADHGYASIAGGNRVTWHHNLFAHDLSRNVRFGGLVDADFRNNVIYDWGHTCGNGEFDRVNYIGNYVKAGPSTTQRPLLFIDGEGTALPGSLFVTNNILEGAGKEPGVNQDNWRGMGYYFERATVAAAQPFPAPPVTTELPAAAYEHVLQEAGATLPRRDAVDERIVNETRSGGGHIIKWVKDAGGWPNFPSATVAPEDNAK